MLLNMAMDQKQLLYKVGVVELFPAADFTMDGKIDLEEDALEYVNVNEFIDCTTPDGGWNA
jgi:hypothetical protein